MKIVSPPKLYLDTNHLCCISRLRRGQLNAANARFRDAYAFLSACITQGRVGLVFQLMAPVEWVGGNATLQSANELADIFDTAPLSYHVECDTFVYTSEVLAECRRMNPTLAVPRFDLFWCRDSAAAVQPGIVVLSRLVPDVYPLSEATSSPTSLLSGKMPIRLAVERALNLKHNDPNRYAERIAGFAAAMEDDFDATAKRIPKSREGFSRIGDSVLKGRPDFEGAESDD